MNQAAVLLGSLDILGNPLGLIQDFSSGMEGLLKQGNIGGLFVNVAHGFSDSAAKVIFKNLFCISNLMLIPVLIKILFFLFSLDDWSNC